MKGVLAWFDLILYQTIDAGYMAARQDVNNLERHACLPIRLGGREDIVRSWSLSRFSVE